MNEKKVLSAKAIVLYILAGLCLLFGVLFATPVTDNIGGINLDKVFTGVILLVAGTYFLIPIFVKHKDNFKWLIFIEIIVIILVSLLGFILPEFIDSLNKSNLVVNQWAGLLLIFHAVVHLVVDRFSQTKIKNYLFLLYILLAIFGGLLLDSKSINIPFFITIFIVGLFVVIAIILGYKAFKLPKVMKKVEEVKEKKEKEKKA